LIEGAPSAEEEVFLLNPAGIRQRAKPSGKGLEIFPSPGNRSSEEKRIKSVEP